MAAPAALLAVKAAVAVAVDKRGRNVIASVVAAVLVPFVLVIIMLLSIMDGTSSHNVSAVDQVFRGADSHRRRKRISSDAAVPDFGKRKENRHGKSHL